MKYVVKSKNLQKKLQKYSFKNEKVKIILQ